MTFLSFVPVFGETFYKDYQLDESKVLSEIMYFWKKVDEMLIILYTDIIIKIDNSLNKLRTFVVLVEIMGNKNFIISFVVEAESIVFR